MGSRTQERRPRGAQLVPSGSRGNGLCLSDLHGNGVPRRCTGSQSEIHKGASLLGDFLCFWSSFEGRAICSRRCRATPHALIRRLYQDGISRDQFSGSMGLQLSPTPLRWKNLTWRENKWTEEAEEGWREDRCASAPKPSYCE